SLLQALRQPNVWFLALGIFATNMGGIALGFWLAPTIKGYLGRSGADADDSIVLLWTGLVYLCGTVGVISSGYLADRTGQRKWCCVIGQMGAGLALAASTIPGQPWLMIYAWFCVAGFFANFWFSPYWVLPSLALTSSAAAVSIGFINMFANVPGYFSNELQGLMKTANYSPENCVLVLGMGFFLGGLLVACVRIRKLGETSTRE
ncbi:MAG TPA: hypothetical protein VGL71_07770, partial [Urbifossiella sp.]